MTKPEKDVKIVEPEVTAPATNEEALTNTPATDTASPTVDSAPPIDAGTTTPEGEDNVLATETKKDEISTVEDKTITSDSVAEAAPIDTTGFKFKYSPINGVGNAIIAAIQYSEEELEHLEKFVGHYVIKEKL